MAELILRFFGVSELSFEVFAALAGLLGLLLDAFPTFGLLRQGFVELM